MFILALGCTVAVTACGRDRAASAGRRPPCADGGRVPGWQYLAPQRDAIERPAELVAALGIAPGSVVADVGAGPGYLTLPLARAAGPGGRVIATDIASDFLATCAARARRAGLANVETRTTPADDPGLGARSIDLAVLLHVFPFLPDPPAYLGRLSRALRPDGRIAVITWVDHRDAVLIAARAAGLALAKDEGALLPLQAFLIFVPAAPGQVE